MERINQQEEYIINQLKNGDLFYIKALESLIAVCEAYDALHYTKDAIILYMIYKPTEELAEWKKEVKAHVARTTYYRRRHDFVDLIQKISNHMREKNE